MKPISTAFISSLFLLLACCTGCKKTNTITNNDIAFDSIQIHEVYHLFNDTAKPSCDLQINFIYPVKFGDEKALNNLQALFVSKYFGDNFIGKTPAEAARSYTEEYLKSYKEVEEEYNENEEISQTFSYYENSFNSIHFNKGGILACMVFFENYMGGAHGSHQLYGYSIDLNTGKLISDKDIFYENCMDKVADIIVNKLMEQNNLTDRKELEDSGYTDIEKIVPNDNFLIDEQGITYIYNEYEIAPYFIGKTKIFLPYNEISLFIKPESAVKTLIQ